MAALNIPIQRWGVGSICPLTLSHFEGHWMHLTQGWTESSISLELTKTGASGEKLECYGSSVSHGVHASRETQQSRQGSTSHLSLLLSLVLIWINSVQFLFLPSSIIKLHTHLPPSRMSSRLAVKFWIGYAPRRLWTLLRRSQTLANICSFNCCEFFFFFFSVLSSEMTSSCQRYSWCLEMSVQRSKSDAITLRFPVIISQSVFLSCDSFLAWVSFSPIIYFDIHAASILQMTIKFVYFLFDFNSVIVNVLYCKNTYDMWNEFLFRCLIQTWSTHMSCYPPLPYNSGSYRLNRTADPLLQWD